jgi:DNA-binding CsgD family transcriptional regulator
MTSTGVVASNSAHHPVRHRHEPYSLCLCVMHHRLDTLTDREKETLRLLLVGHDAKSIAVHLGLSVHTINERLRDARRKLGVSSSREAARFLNEAEQADPHSLANKQFGVSSEASERPSQEADQAPHSAHRFAWFGGGMLIMSLIIAAALLASMIHRGGVSAPQGASVSAATATLHPAGLGPVDNLPLQAG